MKKFVLLLTALLISVGLATAQQRVVKSTVTSSEDGSPVIGASVVLKTDMTKGTTTDFDGKFRLEVPASAKTLLVSFMGMKTEEVAITSGDLKIVLTSDSKVMDEVVVTGYSTTSKKAFTGAASSVGSETVKGKFDANPINALNGNVPGLQMSQASGQPGAPTTIFVRGRNSLNSGTQPLYVIDGVPLETSVMATRANEGAELTPLSTLNSDDIQSITVLKDATATSIYGARAANGVIVITTKRGRAGFKMNFSARMGASMMPHTINGYRPVDAATYKQLVVEGILNTHKYNSLGLPSLFDNINAEYSLGLTPDAEGAAKFLEEYTGIKNVDGAGTNWLKEVTRMGFQQNYNIDLSGGGDTPRSPRYFISFDYMNDKGIVRGKDLERYTLRLNLDQAPFEFFSYGVNTSFSMTTTNMGAGGAYFSDPITQAFMQSPMSVIKDKNGNWNFKTINGYNPVAQRSELGDKNLGKQ